MPTQILMPKLGLTMTEGQLLSWEKQEGDPVQKGDILYTLETEKVVYEVESPADGVLGPILVGQGRTVAVGTVVGYLLRPGESPEDVEVGQAEEPAARLPEVRPAAEPPAQPPPPAGPERVRATPLAKKWARKLGVGLASVKGSGKRGRIHAVDVKAAAGAAPTPSAGVEPPAEEERLVPLTGMRRTIAANMLASKLEAAQAYMALKADATRLKAFRRRLLPEVEERHGARLTFTDLLLKITGQALLRHPVINTRWTGEGVLFLGRIHLGLAMALEEGLIVPVIRDVNAKSLGRIAAERVELIQRGRAGRLLPDDLTGSTFTLSTLGMFGIEDFSPIINQPESAILGIGAINDQVVVTGDGFRARPLVPLNLTYDHRVIDGAEAARFLKTLEGLIQDPARLMV